MQLGLDAGGVGRTSMMQQMRKVTDLVEDIICEIAYSDDEEDDDTSASIGFKLEGL